MKKELMTNGSSELSTDITTIAAEISAFKRIAGEAIFEIGRRLKHVKENDLAHGEFGKWLDKIGFNDRMARKFMKVTSEISTEWTMSSDLGLEALYQIATLPESERTQTHTTAKGEEKKPEEMTVKELRELKRQLKEVEQAKERAETSARAEKAERERLEQANEALAKTAAVALDILRNK